MISAKCEGWQFSPWNGLAWISVYDLKRQNVSTLAESSFKRLCPFLVFFAYTFLSIKRAPQWPISPRQLYKKRRLICHLFIISKTNSEKQGLNYYWLNSLSCTGKPKFLWPGFPYQLNSISNLFPQKKLMNSERKTYSVSTPEHVQYSFFPQVKVFCISTFWDTVSFSPPGYSPISWKVVIN